MSRVIPSTVYFTRDLIDRLQAALDEGQLIPVGKGRIRSSIRDVVDAAEKSFRAPLGGVAKSNIADSLHFAATCYAAKSDQRARLQKLADEVRRVFDEAQRRDAMPP